MMQTEVVKPVVSQSHLRVRYAETDQMGVVYHANYLVWFEVGRVDFIRTLGMDYRTMEREDGVGIAVVDVSARYKLPARYDDELVVETRLIAARGPVIKFGYKILRPADGTLLCEGETVHVVVDRQMKKAALPEKYAKRFAEVVIR
jgi:acyl-CoA thioester hydrolase